jgi:hypothetical protein
MHSLDLLNKVLENIPKIIAKAANQQDALSANKRKREEVICFD